MPSGLPLVVGLVLFGLVALGIVLVKVRQSQGHLRVGPSRFTPIHQETQKTATENSGLRPYSASHPKTKLCLGSNTSPEVAIERCSAALSQHLMEIPADRQLVERLSPLLQHAPSLALTAAVAATPDLYVLSFSPPVAEGLANGSYDLARSAEGGFRALALSDGGIIENANLDPVTALQASAAALAVWQVLSIIVAQQHLSKINAHLQSLSAEVVDIRSWLDNSRWGRLSGKHSYLQQLFRQLHSYMPSKEDALTLRHQLETIERETLEDLSAIDLELETFVTSIANIPLVSRWGTDKDSLIVGERIERLSALVRQRHLAIHVRGVSAQLVACLPGGLHRAKQLVQTIDVDVGRERFFSQGHEAFVSLINEKISSRVSPDKAADNRKNLRSELEAAERSLVSSSEAIRKGLQDLRRALDAQIERQRQGLQLVARLDQAGRVTRLYRPA